MYSHDRIKFKRQRTNQAVDIIFMDDLDYYMQYMVSLTYEEFKSFLEECPDFMENRREVLNVILELKKELKN